MTLAHFTLAYWCILAVALLPVICAGIAKYGTLRTAPKNGGYDNNNPREWLARQTDWRARANAAQANTFEAIPFFFAAVIIAHQLQASQAWVDGLALLFVVLRIVYIGLYVTNRASARSFVWAIALFTNIGILFIGFR